MTYVDVALPLALPTALTYSVPDDLIARAVMGARVVVPVQKREMIGIVTGVGRPPPAARARAVLEAPDETPVLDSTLLQLAAWAAADDAQSTRTSAAVFFIIPLIPFAVPVAAP